MRTVQEGRGRGQGSGLVFSRRVFLFTPLALLGAEKKPNVVLVIARGWRGVATPWSDNTDVQAPNLAKFAENAVVFPRTYACDPQTDPARSGILTGRYPHVNGVITDGAAMRAEEVTLGSVLKVAGYHQLEGIEALQAGAASPFFLSVNLEVPRISKAADGSKLHIRSNVPRELELQALTELADRYGGYTAMDEEFGKLLTALDRTSAASDTIVVFTSDHGEQIGSHGIEGSQVAYEESVRVPLAIRFPRVLKAEANDVVASQVDIVPTVLGLVGEPAFEGVEGHDLSPLLLGAKADRPEFVFAEGKIGQKDEWRMVVVGTDKLVADAAGAVSGLYNLSSDPYEMKNLAADSSVQLKRDELLATLRAAKSQLLDFKRR
jgi:arylsulfatase A-like enzyme